jgi:transposase
VEALHGRIRDHHRRLLKVHLELVATLEQALEETDAAVGRTLAPIHNSARLLTTLPGVSDLPAQVMVEIGVDGARFPTAAHRISWTGLCPRSDDAVHRANVAAHRWRCRRHICCICRNAPYQAQSREQPDSSHRTAYDAAAHPSTPISAHGGAPIVS